MISNMTDILIGSNHSDLSGNKVCTQKFNLKNIIMKTQKNKNKKIKTFIQNVMVLS